jgi:hypothetical protein
LVFAAIGVWSVIVFAALGYFVVKMYLENEHRKNAATNACVYAIRAHIQSDLSLDGLSAPRDAELAGQAHFTSIDARKTITTEGVETLFLDGNPAHRSENLLAVWEVSGKVILPQPPDHNSLLGTDNDFGCTSVFFKDGSVVTVEDSVLQTEESMLQSR